MCVTRDNVSKLTEIPTKQYKFHMKFIHVDFCYICKMFICVNKLDSESRRVKEMEEGGIGKGGGRKRVRQKRRN